jgi:WD40 repeat protein
MKTHLVLPLLLFLVACVPDTQINSGLTTTQDAAVAPVFTLPETPSPGDPLARAYPYPPLSVLPTSPYPGAAPWPPASELQPDPTPTIGIQPVANCELHPSFSRCGGVPLTGRLAFVRPDGVLAVLDLDAEAAWSSNQADVRDLAWSPEGNLLLVHDKTLQPFLYQADGFLFGSLDHPLRWQKRGHILQTATLIWSDDDLMAASLLFLEAADSDESQAQVERSVQIDFYDGSNQRRWLLEDPAYRGDVITLLDWAPRTEWLVFGRAYGGTGTRYVSGYHLFALNGRTGEISDSGLSIPQGAHFDWHPTIAGLLVTTDLLSSEVMGAGKLALWDLFENRRSYPLAGEELAQTPVWSPDGRYIAYSSFDSGSAGNALMVLDSLSGATTALAEHGTASAWSRNGATLFYLELIKDKPTAGLRAVASSGGQSWIIAESRLPSCPGTCLYETAFAYAP